MQRGFMLRFLILETFDFPVAWHMFRDGTQLGWIGYQLDVTRFEVGFSVQKKQWRLTWPEDRLREGGVVGRNLRATLGRLCLLRVR